MIKISAVQRGINGPHVMVSVLWEVDGHSGSSECAAWQAQGIIDQLSRAGYKVLDVVKA